MHDFVYFPSFFQSSPSPCRSLPCRSLPRSTNRSLSSLFRVPVLPFIWLLCVIFPKFCVLFSPLPVLVLGYSPCSSPHPPVLSLFIVVYVSLLNLVYILYPISALVLSSISIFIVDFCKKVGSGWRGAERMMGRREGWQRLISDGDGREGLQSSIVATGDYEAVGLFPP